MSIDQFFFPGIPSPRISISIFKDFQDTREPCLESGDFQTYSTPRFYVRFPSCEFSKHISSRNSKTETKHWLLYYDLTPNDIAKFPLFKWHACKLAVQLSP